MKKRLIILFSMFICTFVTGCTMFQNNENLSNNNFKIVTSFYPMYIIALNLTEGINNVEISNMSEQHKGCLHDFNLNSDNMKKIEQASVFIINGVGMESFMDKIINQIPKITVIDSSIDISLLDNAKNSHNEHNHQDEKNSHIWLSVDNYIKQVENISNQLIIENPINKAKYTENTQKYIGKLNNLRSKMHAELDNLENKNIVTLHEAFPYLAKDFKINIIATMDYHSESSPNSKEVAEFTELIRKNNIKAIFVEKNSVSPIADAIAKETNAKIFTLDAGTSGSNSMDDYINSMEYNTKILKEALS